MASVLNASYLFASLLWGSIGIGYVIYGKRQHAWVPMVGGGLMIIASYFVVSALFMSLFCLGLMAAVYFLLKQGY